MLRLPDDWVWDSWVADDGETYHLYFLKAPRALEDPSRRHARAVIGHATSTDLVDWTDRGTTLLPAESGWDDLASGPARRCWRTTARGGCSTPR
jgi:beta-fructofuranosidase